MPVDKQQRQKNLTLLCVLLGLAAVLFFITIVKIAYLAAPGK